MLRRADSSCAEDAVAEVFIVCWRRLHEIPADPLPWLLGVARRVLSTQRRSERRRQALDVRLAEVADGPAQVEPSMADGVLARALSSLSDADRELLLLIAWEELSPGQAATVLELKPQTARMRLMRARRRLSQALAREESSSRGCGPELVDVSPGPTRIGGAR